MSNYSAARVNMVDSQIHPSGVVSAAILEAFRKIPREDFVPERLRGQAYTDEDLPLGNGQFLMEPVVLARMLEAVQIKSDDVVLSIGDSTGYSTAILNELAHTVMTDGTVAGQSSCTLIVMSGAVAEVPQNLLSCLAVGGRLVTILKETPGPTMGTVVLVQRTGDSQYSTRKQFDASTPYIPGYEPRSEFKF